MNDYVAIAALDLARELVRDGWTQGAYVRSPAGWAVATDAKNVRRVCAAGAIDRAGLALDIPLVERELLRAWLAMQLELDPTDDLAVEKWNDKAGRSRDEVIAAYDALIERVKTAAA